MVFSTPLTAVWVGGNWNFKIENAPVLSLAVSPNFSEDNLLFAGTEEAGVFYSKDRGMTWVLAADEEQVGSVNSILVSEDFLEEPCIVIANGELIILSRDHGQTWQPWRENLQFDDLMLSIAALEDVCPGSKLLVGLANGQILKV